MASQSNARPSLVVYREILEGDLRKLRAESNVSLSGGGARDLRFPWRSFRGVMHRIFTRDATGRGGRAIRVADFIYLDDDEQPRTTQLEYWPATGSRPREDRISKVHKSPALGGQLPESGRGKVFVLLIQFSDGTARCTYAYEEDLLSSIWAQELSAAIRACITLTWTKNLGRASNFLPVQGYYDFRDGTHFCHAD